MVLNNRYFAQATNSVGQPGGSCELWQEAWRSQMKSPPRAAGGPRAGKRSTRSSKLVTDGLSAEKELFYICSRRKTRKSVQAFIESASQLEKEMREITTRRKDEVTKFLLCFRVKDLLCNRKI
jgi:hypothetical protein